MNKQFCRHCFQNLSSELAPTCLWSPSRTHVPRILSETEQREESIYGETIVEMRSAVMFTDLNDPHETLIYAMGILSDAQEVLKTDREVARQWINKAKYFIAEAKHLLRASHFSVVRS